MGKGRNVNNFFTLISMVDKFIAKTSLFGTVNKQSRELQPSVQNNIPAELYSTSVMGSGKATLIVYRCKINTRLRSNPTTPALMCQGVQTIMDYKGKPSHEVPSDTSLPDKLNAFLCSLRGKQY